MSPPGSQRGNPRPQRLGRACGTGGPSPRIGAGLAAGQGWCGWARGLTHTWEEASPQKGEGLEATSIELLLVCQALGWSDLFFFTFLVIALV